MLTVHRGEPPFEITNRLVHLFDSRQGAGDPPGQRSPGRDL